MATMSLSQDCRRRPVRLVSGGCRSDGVAPPSRRLRSVSSAGSRRWLPSGPRPSLRWSVAIMTLDPALASVRPRRGRLAFHRRVRLHEHLEHPPADLRVYPYSRVADRLTCVPRRGRGTAPRPPSRCKLRALFMILPIMRLRAACLRCRSCSGTPVAQRLSRMVALASRAWYR